MVNRPGRFLTEPVTEPGPKTSSRRARGPPGRSLTLPPPSCSTRARARARLGLAEVDPGLAGRVGQGDEDLGVLAPPGADGVPEDGQAPARRSGPPSTSDCRKLRAGDQRDLQKPIVSSRTTLCHVRRWSEGTPGPGPTGLLGPSTSPGSHSGQPSPGRSSGRQPILSRPTLPGTNPIRGSQQPAKHTEPVAIPFCRFRGHGAGRLAPTGRKSVGSRARWNPGSDRVADAIPGSVPRCLRRARAHHVGTSVAWSRSRDRLGAFAQFGQSTRGLSRDRFCEFREYLRTTPGPWSGPPSVGDPSHAT